MPDLKTSAFPALLGVNLNAADKVPVIDVSDTSTPPAGPGGSNKAMVISEFITGLSTLGGAAIRAGIAGGQTLIGGTAATDRLLLKATTNGAPTGLGVGIFGDTSESLRVRSSDGHVVLGEAAINDAALTKTAVTILDGVAPVNGLVGIGTGGAFAVLADNSVTTSPISSMVHMSQNVTTNSLTTNGFPTSLHVDVVMNCPTFNGLCAQVYGFQAWAYVDGAADYVLFAGQHLAAIRPGVGDKSINAGVANPPKLDCMEADVRDDSAGAATDADYHNKGTAIRLNVAGNADHEAALAIVSVSPGLTAGSGPGAGTFRNGLVCSTNLKTYAPWASGIAYDVGVVAKMTNTGNTITTHYQCKKAHTSAASGSHGPPMNVANGANLNTTDWRVYTQRPLGVTENFLWLGQLTDGGYTPTGTPKFGVDAALGDMTSQGFMRLVGRADPGNPPAGSVYVYVRASDNALVARKPSGTITVLAA